MRISSINLNNFKRFTQLTITNIPDTAKLVLLIGSNGSGKSSVFDAFDWLSKGIFKDHPYKNPDETLQYYRKQGGQKASTEIFFSNKQTIKKSDFEISNHELAKKFIGRSSIRIVSRITNDASPTHVANDLDSPQTYIEADQRFPTDAFLYIQSINKALREPIFSGRQADTLKIFQDFIEPFNTSLKNIFGDNPNTTIRIAEFEEATPQSPPKLIFQKGDSRINYDVLSHGEKQVVILLLNFIVRQEYYKDAIIFIDEMDVHLNTKLQYSTLKEISERWIPDTSQLWTATHALGFIDYANDDDRSIVLDFDDLDYDKPQTIEPATKNNYHIFEIAVSKEFIDKVFQGRTIVFAEETDAPIYNDLGLDSIFFFDGKDKLGAFQKAKNLNLRAIIDRDYLTDDEIRTLKSTYPFLSILPYYSIENLLYHPDNLLEYHASHNLAFDKQAYIDAILCEKVSELPYISGGIAKARDGYPFFKENEYAKRLSTFKNNYKAVIDLLASNQFETVFKVLPAKDYGRTLPQRQNLNKLSLAKTNWFRNSIKTCLES